ncbi:hypothetical protein C3K47_08185 [Solitalea longa]|uniref:Outer membrane protein beta-barrel domain-containing protein n=1 Tax=Solitalea longa TaxID=2079460 RepID=A0A2S5A3Y9_9SPHI|nr:hypothetical protein [Solitalea longa]POY37027.1 hypothetical protein C3K47_08185 [Solitalea longa]
MKKLSLSIIFFFIVVSNSFAQIEYNRFSVEGFGGVTMAFTDALNDNISHVFGGAFHYNTSPFSYFAFDIQSGQLQGGMEGNLRKFTNKYSSFAVTYNLGLGDLLNVTGNRIRQKVNDIYFGAGVSLIRNNVKEVTPYEYSGDGGTFTEGIKFKGSEFVFPLQIGANIKYRTKTEKTPFAFNLQYQFNLSFSDLLDGYEGAPGNKKNDLYSTIWIGVKYFFGPTAIYYRTPR